MLSNLVMTVTIRITLNNSKFCNLDKCDGRFDGGREDDGDDDIIDHESKPAGVS